MIYEFFHFLGQLFSPLAALGKLFPSSLHKLMKLCGCESDRFQKFLVCPCCHNIYGLEDYGWLTNNSQKRALVKQETKQNQKYIYIFLKFFKTFSVIYIVIPSCCCLTYPQALCSLVELEYH